MDEKKSTQVPPLSREQVRQVDQIALDQYGMLGLVLMENAGRGAAEAIHHWLAGDKPKTSDARAGRCLHLMRQRQ